MDAVVSKAHRKQLLQVTGELLSNQENEPISFDSLDADAFMGYLLNCQNTDGSTCHSLQTTTSRQLCFICSMFMGNINLPHSMKPSRWRCRAMTYATYRALMVYFWWFGTEANIFTRTFMVMCWHLMCHTCNIVHVFCCTCYGVMMPWGSSLGTPSRTKVESIAKTKSNIFMQTHLINIGCYLICFPSVVSLNGNLFPETLQYARFR